MTTPVYIRIKQSINTDHLSTIRLGDIARITGSRRYETVLPNMVVHKVKADDQNIVVIDGFMIIEQVLSKFPQVEVELLGPTQCVVHIEKHKKATFSFTDFRDLGASFFIGAAMAIMNFHYDVSMESVQQKLHFMLTGEEKEHPLWIQVPYSLGLGIGMILFFNHWFQKRFNEEPSPMEVEIFNYQQDLDRYVAVKRK